MKLSCCSWPRTCFVIAGIQLTWGLINGLLGILNLTLHFSTDDFFKEDPELDHDHGDYVTGSSVLHFLIFIISIPESVVLAVGVKKESIKVVYCWMCLLAFEWCIYMAHGIYILFRHEHPTVSILLGIAYILTTIVLLYYFFTGMTFVTALKDRDKAKEQDEENLVQEQPPPSEPAANPEVAKDDKDKVTKPKEEKVTKDGKKDMPTAESSPAM